MGVGKYSPTVSTSYARNQKWWYENGGGFGNGNNPDSDLDNDGFDSYGYSGDCGQGVDRAGHCETDYYKGAYDSSGEYYYPLAEDVYSEWSGVYIPDGNWPLGANQLVALATKIIDGKAGLDSLPKEAQDCIRKMSDDPGVLELLAKAYAHGVRQA